LSVDHETYLADWLSIPTNERRACLDDVRVHFAVLELKGKVRLFLKTLGLFSSFVLWHFTTREGV